MATLPRSRGIKSNNGHAAHPSGSDEDLEALPLSSATNPINHSSRPDGYSILHNPLSHHPSPRSRSRSIFLLTASGFGLIALCFLLVSIRSFFPAAPSSSSSPASLLTDKAYKQEWPFITIQKGTNFFMEGCRPYFVTGINVDNLVEAAMKEVSEAAKTQGPERISGREMVRNLLQTAAKKGLNVVRTWAHTTDPSHPVQNRPGEYIPDALEALDYVVAQAEAAGVRVQLSFVDMWRYRGGIAEYVDWSRTAPKRDPRYPPLIVEGDVTPEMMTEEREAYENTRRALFYTDPDARAMYKAHVTAILTHKNVFTGKIYKEDPTIFGFGLINEPRCLVTEAVPNCAELLQRWIEEMAAHFRTVDTVHLLTVGEEGFYGLGDPSEKVNPGFVGGSHWAAESGQDFIKNHQAPGISYAAIHAWPDNWFSEDKGEFITSWIEEHAQDAEKRLLKPVLLEEVGKKVEPAPGTAFQLATIRDPVYRTVYKAVERSMAEYGALQGSMLWQMEFRLYDQSPSTPYDVKFNDSTFVLVDRHVARVKRHALTHPLVYSNDYANPIYSEKSKNMASDSENNEKSGHDAALLKNTNSVCTAEKAAEYANYAPCWVGNAMALGFIRRCTNRPALCREISAAFEGTTTTVAATAGTPAAAAPAPVQSRWDATAGTLASPAIAVKVFGSKEECCAEERGAFASGCSLFTLK